MGHPLYRVAAHPSRRSIGAGWACDNSDDFIVVTIYRRWIYRGRYVSVQSPHPCSVWGGDHKGPTSLWGRPVAAMVTTLSSLAVNGGQLNGSVVVVMSAKPLLRRVV